jgi:hypothetical protein
MKYRTRMINDDTVKIFQHLLKHEDWELVYLNKDINGMVNTFLNTFINIFEASLPVKYKNLNINKRDWIPQGIKVSCRHKRSLYILSRSCDDPRIKKYYKTYCLI